ncbi:MAG: type II toxin-antitoxin system RelB/DinJ family antitoxin [Pseudoflavonifractor sp.]
MEHSISQAKTDTFKMRINPDFRGQLETVFEKTGLTLTDAVNVFFQQALNAGGLPFSVTADNAELLKTKALARLTGELELGRAEPLSYDEDRVYGLFGVSP